MDKPKILNDWRFEYIADSHSPYNQLKVGGNIAGEPFVALVKDLQAYRNAPQFEAGFHVGTDKGLIELGSKEEQNV